MKRFIDNCKRTMVPVPSVDLRYVPLFQAPAAKKGDIAIIDNCKRVAMIYDICRFALCPPFLARRAAVAAGGVSKTGCASRSVKASIDRWADEHPGNRKEDAMTRRTTQDEDGPGRSSRRGMLKADRGGGRAGRDSNRQ